MADPANWQKLEALLFIVPKPLTIKRIAQLLPLKITEIEALIQQCNDFYEKQDRAFHIVLSELGYQLRLRPEFSPMMKQVDDVRSKNLSPKNLETLSIIAYKQPITRGEIEAIRSVDCGHSLQSLLDKGLITIVGRKEKPGNPLLYGTSSFFLEMFGFKSLDDLPQAAELE